MAVIITIMVLEMKLPEDSGGDWDDLQEVGIQIIQICDLLLFKLSRLYGLWSR